MIATISFQLQMELCKSVHKCDLCEFLKFEHFENVLLWPNDRFA